MADEDKRPFVGLENAGKFWASVVALVEQKVLARFTDAEKTKLAGIDMSTKLDASEKGSANGVAELDDHGIVLSSQLPSYVDDVLEYASSSAFPASGESGKIYVALDTNLAYRWAGSSYTEISPSLALGETSSTAYRGDRGKAAYDHAQARGSAFSSDLYKITTNAEGHVTAATPATSADIVAFLNNQALTPSSVAATGAVSGSTVSDSVGSLADLRDSVSCIVDRDAITVTSYTSPDRKTGMQLKYVISSGKYYVVAKHEGSWLFQKEI